jgi:hypothetical protein
MTRTGGDRAMSHAHEQATAADGRWLDGHWYGAYTNYTVNCTDHGGGGCTGWISPTLGLHPCMHPRHDESRMTYEAARELTEQRLAALDAAERAEPVMESVMEPVVADGADTTGAAGDVDGW